MSTNGIGVGFCIEGVDAIQFVSLSLDSKTRLLAIARAMNLRDIDVLRQIHGAFGRVTQVEIEEYYKMLFGSKN